MKKLILGLAALLAGGTEMATAQFTATQSTTVQFAAAQSTAAQPKAAVGGALIDLELCDAQGGYVYLADYVGGSSGEKYLMVYFWTCSACLREVDQVVREVERYADRLDVVAVNLSNDPQGWGETYAGNNPFPWDNLSDGKPLAEGAVLCYPIPRFPTYVLVDPAGKIEAIWSDTAAVAEQLKACLEARK